MKHQGFLKFRIVFSIVMGVFFLIQAPNPNFLKPAVEARAVFVHIFVGLFGAAFLAQAALLGKKLTSQSLY